MARIAGVDLPKNKRIEIALTYIYGLGLSSSQKILEKAIEEKKYVFNLNRPFNIQELNINDPRIPIFLQKKNIFDYLD